MRQEKTGGSTQQAEKYKKEGREGQQGKKEEKLMRWHEDSETTGMMIKTM